MKKGRESNLHTVRVHVIPFVYVASFANDLVLYIASFRLIWVHSNSLPF